MADRTVRENSQRDDMLFGISDEELNLAIWAEIDKISPTAKDGLAGIDARTDMLTRNLWEQVCYAADMDASENGYHVERTLRAVRVAKAILIVQGWSE